MQQKVRVDERGIQIPDGVDEPVSVEFDGRRVWAVVPERDGRSVRDGHRVLDWPPLLRPHLNGHADITVRTIGEAQVLFDGEVSFGTGEGRISLLDPRGRPLTVDKGDRVGSGQFETIDAEAKHALLDAVDDALAVLAAHGHDGFLAFGCLLGAVRDGLLIGHDNDADVVYLARAEHPLDVIVESMAVERDFIAAGWETRRLSGGDFKLLARLPGRTVGIDVFTAFYLDGLLHVMPNIITDLPREALLPQSTVTLEGRQYVAPADPDALLEATYGPGWRVPDPSFKYDPPQPVRRRLNGLMRGERKHYKYWDGFYATHAARVPTEPSSFARWVAERSPPGTSFVDVGSGTGRDSLWLAEQGFPVLGLDYARSGVRYASRRARQRGVVADFAQLNLYDLRQLLAQGAHLPRTRRIDAVYARFLVHALERDGRTNLWRFSRSVLAATRGRLFLEFRTAATEHKFGEHFREFVQPEVVEEELRGYGFVIEHSENRHGLAVHKDEDPLVSRIVAKMEAPR